MAEHGKNTVSNRPKQSVVSLLTLAIRDVVKTTLGRELNYIGFLGNGMYLPYYATAKRYLGIGDDRSEGNYVCDLALSGVNVSVAEMVPRLVEDFMCRFEGQRGLEGLRILDRALNDDTFKYLIRPNTEAVVGIDNDSIENQEENYQFLRTVVNDYLPNGKIVGGFVYAINWENNPFTPRLVLEEARQKGTLDYVRFITNKKYKGSVVYFWDHARPVIGSKISDRIMTYTDKHRGHLSGCDDCLPYKNKLDPAAKALAECLAKPSKLSLSTNPEYCDPILLEMGKNGSFNKIVIRPRYGRNETAVLP